jgi:uncharacterized protein (DUF58 family)
MTGVRPTRAMLFPLAAAAVMYGLAKVAGGAWLSLAATAFLVLPLVALLLPPHVPELHLPASEHRVAVGEVLTTRLAVRNQGRRTTSPMQLTEQVAGLEQVVVALPALRPGQEATVDLRRRAVARGVYEGGSALLTSTSPLGLLRAGREMALPSRIVVHPLVHQTARVPGMATVGPGELSVPLPGVGTEVLGLREWRSGDSARAVAARASARHSRPMVLERERETASKLVLLAGGPGRGPAWEEAVSTAASYALAALQSGTPPLLLGRPAPARVDRTGILDWFAAVDDVSGLDQTAVAAGLRAATGGTLVLLIPTGLIAERMSLRRACDAARTALVVLDA